jgi:hypothetical protein
MLICNRELLKAARTYYVRTDGSDTNNGLTNTAAGAFVTIQKAIDVALNTLDFGGFDVTIQIGDGTYAAGASITGPQTGRGTLTLQGNTTPGNASNVEISVTSGNAITLSRGAAATVRALKMTTTGTGGVGLQVLGSSTCTIDNVVFGAAAAYQIQVAQGALLNATSYAIAGNATNHLAITHGATVYYQNITITLTTALTFTAFLHMEFGGSFRAEAINFSGSATGLRYYMRTCATVRTYGNTNANYFPGSTAGQVWTGAEYDTA